MTTGDVGPGPGATNALEVRDLRIAFGDVEAVAGVSFDLRTGRRLGLIGESGCGKSLTALAVMGLLPRAASATGVARFADGFDVLSASDHALSRERGRRMSMVFQEPMTALNPLMRVGRQVAEPLVLHEGWSRSKALDQAQVLLERVGLDDPSSTVRAFPHQLSGGQRQRVMLAMAVACRPDLVIADEPTTALDVTVQAQILRVLDDLVEQEGCSLLLISHDLPVISSICEDVVVMYGGQVAESGPIAQVVGQPRHPYTQGLLGAVIDLDHEGDLRSIPGIVPALGKFPTGCRFRNRCDRANDQCAEVPELEGDGHDVACWHPLLAPA